MEILKKIGKIVFRVLIAIVLIAVLFLGTLTLLEYRPDDEEIVNVAKSDDPGLRAVNAEDSIELLSWNIGYGALGDNADFFMDGGTGVHTADEDRVRENLDSISTVIKSYNPDVILLQEIDVDSTRSHHINQTEYFINEFGSGYESSFAYNYNAKFVPYPLPPLGKIESGLFTFSRIILDEAKRVSLPCPFSWPIRTVNLKRCLLVDRFPISGSDKELVIVNLHLEAYDSGDGKIAQTKELIRIINEERAKGNYVIAGGDFNQTFSDVEMYNYPVYPERWLPGIIDVTDFEKGSEHNTSDYSWQLLMDSSAPTCRSLDQPYKDADLSKFQYYVIDGYIVSDNIKVESLKTLDVGFVASDHNPILLKIRLL